MRIVQSNKRQRSVHWTRLSQVERPQLTDFEHQATLFRTLLISASIARENKTVEDSRLSEREQLILLVIPEYYLVSV